ncbi:hypothetical protein A0130_04655 [Leifsonia xyli]|uniref:DUF3060 domain-containing protein n=1 Tax=Leifsonia xyli TaxID=1575 RepID=UPI0007CDE955|nr:hypothetical protein A0130_04655 [Leifsonia xyli]
MRKNLLVRALAVGALAIAAGSVLSACSVQDGSGTTVPSGKVTVEIDGKKTTYDDGTSITGAGKPISVGTNKSKATIACTGGEAITLLGDTGTITLSGDCGDISATGAHTHVTLDSGKELSILGANNVITAGVVDALKVTGAGNKVTYASSTSEPELLGVNNDVTKK